MGREGGRRAGKAAAVVGDGDGTKARLAGGGGQGQRIMEHARVARRGGSWSWTQYRPASRIEFFFPTLSSS
jgi:hypothetical protein